MLKLFVRRFSINVAVVGSGPAGFYTVQKLLRNPNICVDIYEKQPVPFGLVRYGVAPDHAEVKNVIRSFTKIAESDRVNFYGNVGLGQDLALEDLTDSYHGVILAYGAANDKLLNIEGEQTTRNTLSARNFVGWYNGLPEDKNLDVNFDCDTACIIGQGNVALDCARILLNPPGLDKTDITSYAHEKLSKSKIKRIYVIGRRGPVQASFTPKELRQMIQLRPSCMKIEPKEMFKIHRVSDEDLSKISRQKKRLTKLFSDLDSIQPSMSNVNKNIECIFKFFSRPSKIEPKSSIDNSVGSLLLQGTGYETKDDFLDHSAKPVELEAYEKIICGLIIRSIGYKASLVDPKLPYNHKLGAIANTNGRIHGFKNIYCSGWLATGASGVIAGTLNSSQVTAQSMLTDIEGSKWNDLKYEKPGSKKILRLLSASGKKVVHFNDWLKIDELERRLGELAGKTREKFVDVDEMLKVVEESRGTTNTTAIN